MPDIEGISGVAIANVETISGKGIANLNKFGGVTKAASVAIRTTNLQTWLDPADGAADSNNTFIDSTNYSVDYTGLTLENLAATGGYSDNGGYNVTLYGDHRLLNAATSAFTTIDNRGVISLDGTNDVLFSAARNLGGYGWPTHPSAITTTHWWEYLWYDMSTSTGSGWSVELWFKRNGAWASNANILGTYNEAFRFRVQSDKLVGVGMKIGSSTWNTNIDMSSTGWRHIVVTFDPSLSSNHMKIYMDGSLAAQRSGTSSISSTTWINNSILIGAYQTTGSERAKMYVGAFRMYNAPISSSDVSQNYNGEKSSYGIT